MDDQVNKSQNLDQKPVKVEKKITFEIDKNSL